MALPVDQLTWLRGEDRVKRFELASAKSWCNAFCDTCGSGLPWRTRNGRAYIVPVGGIDDDLGERPTRNIWTKSRASWHVDATSLPSFDEEPPPSRG